MHGHMQGPEIQALHAHFAGMPWNDTPARPLSTRNFVTHVRAHFVNTAVQVRAHGSICLS